MVLTTSSMFTKGYLHDYALCSTMHTYKILTSIPLTEFQVVQLTVILVVLEALSCRQGCIDFFSLSVFKRFFRPFAVMLTLAYSV